jgi:hypothetical protein
MPSEHLLGPAFIAKTRWLEFSLPLCCFMQLSDLLFVVADQPSKDAD